MRKILLPVLFILIVTVIGVACGGPAAAPTATSVPPAKPTTPPASAPTATSVPAAKPTNTPAQALDGKALMNERCGGCHSTERVQTAKKSKAEWETTVARMKAKGTKLNDAETAALIDFLAATYK